MGFIDEDDFITAYSMQMGYRKADNFLLLEADQDAVGLIPEDFARSNSVLAVKRSDSAVTIVMEDPEDIATIDSVKRLTGLEPDIVVAGFDLINKDFSYNRTQKSYIFLNVSGFSLSYSSHNFRE